VVYLLRNCRQTLVVLSMVHPRSGLQLRLVNFGGDHGHIYEQEDAF
jgi:hypothetical protein